MNNICNTIRYCSYKARIRRSMFSDELFMISSDRFRARRYTQIIFRNYHIYIIFNKSLSVGKMRNTISSYYSGYGKLRHLLGTVNFDLFNNKYFNIFQSRIVA